MQCVQFLSKVTEHGSCLGEGPGLKKIINLVKQNDWVHRCTANLYGKKYGNSFEQNRPNGYVIEARMTLGRTYQKGFPEALMGYEERWT